MKNGKENRMNILAIDTTSNRCSCAILKEEEIIDEINLDSGKTHSETLMPNICEILSKNEMQLSDINLISCCVGPGSFTGIRIGVASAKAMAQVNEIPIASVTSLETLARIDVSDKIKVAMLDARNNQVYCGIFDEDYQLLEEFLADAIENVLQTLKKYENIICMGDGAKLHQDKIKMELAQVQFCEENEQRAALGGKIAYQKYKNQELKNADTICPVYLRKSQAERMKMKREND